MTIGAGAMAASFTLTKHGYRCAPVTSERVEGLGSGPIVGKAIVIEGEGYVTAATPANLMSEVANLKAAMDRSGQDVVIYGPNDVAEHTLLAARSIEGGPHVFFEFASEGGNLLRRVIKFRVEAQTLKVPNGPGGDDDEEEDAENYEQTDSIRPDGLRTVTRRAQMRGPNLLARFSTNVLPAFQQGFDSRSWVITQEYSASFAGDKLDYTLTATQLRTAMPAAAAGAGAVDMNLVRRRDRDERHRLVETWEFDVLATGDYQRIIDTVRSMFTGAGYAVTRESTAVSDYHELRIRASFSTLRSADGTGTLLDWSQSFRLVSDAVIYDVKKYPGLSPVLVERPRDVAKLVQSGTAVSVGAPVTPPGPLFAELLEAPEVEQVSLNHYEYATRWTYVMVAPGGLPASSELRRPGVP